MTVAEAPLKGQAVQSPANTTYPTRRKIFYGFLAFLVVAVVVAVPVTVTQFLVHRRSTRGTSFTSSSAGSKPLTQEYCSRLQGLPRNYCSAYLKAVGPNKFTTASMWLQASQATRECPAPSTYKSVCRSNSIVYDFPSQSLIVLIALCRCVCWC